MPTRMHLRVCLSWLGILLLAGCGTVARTKDGAATGGPAGSELDESPAAVERRIEAHARYATGVVHDLNEETAEAVEEYYQAALLDLKNEDFILEITRRLLQLKESDKAIDLLEKATQPRRSSPALLARLALAYSFAGQSEEAVKAIRAAIKRDPETVTHYQQLAQFLFQQEDYEAGLEALRQALAKAGDSTSVLAELADQCLALSRTEASLKEPALALAREILEKALEQNPRNPLVQQRLADGFLMLGDNERAADLYVKLLERFPHLPGMRERLVDIYIRQQDSKKALEQLESVLKENPTNLRAHYLLGSLAYDQRDMEKAGQHFRQVLILNPDFEQAYYDLAGTLINQDKGREALEILDKARTKFPERFVTELYSGLAYTRLKDYSQAVKKFEAAEIVARATDTNRLTHTFYFQLGAAYERNKQFEEAERYLRKCLELAPDSAETMNYLGYMWADRGENLEEARELISKAVTMEPKNAAYLDSMAWVLFKMKQHREALDYMLKAIDLAEEPDPVLFDHVGDIYAALEEKQKAREAWEKSISLEPNDAIKSKLKAVQNAAPSKP